MKTLFCFSLELNQSKDKNTLKTEELIELCETNFQNFWGILFNFASSFGKSLPILIKARIIELECDILLK